MNYIAAYLKNSFLRWYWEHGGEEIIGPEGPVMGSVLGPYPDPWRRASGPHPDPWKGAVAQLIAAAQVKEVASRVPPGPQREAMLRSAALSIETVLDDWCGTPPRKHPWPWPGPPPWVWEIASELTSVANGFEAGTLRDELVDLAAKAVARASGEPRSQRG